MVPLRFQGHIAKEIDEIGENSLEEESVITAAVDIDPQSEESLFTFLEYTVQPHDTLEGIALSYNMK